MIPEGEAALAAQKGAAEQGVAAEIVNFGKDLGCGVTAGIGNDDRISCERSDAAKLRATVAGSLVKTTNQLCTAAERKKTQQYGTTNINLVQRYGATVAVPTKATLKLFKRNLAAATGLMYKGTSATGDRLGLRSLRHAGSHQPD